MSCFRYRFLLRRSWRKTEPSDQEMADSVLEVSLTANMQKLQELIGDDGIYDVLMEYMEPRLVLRDQAKREEGLREGLKKGVQKGR